MKISFIITSFNVAPYIAQCLDSLKGCVRPGDEVILVDDGSSDHTDLLAEKRFAKGFGPDVATQLVLLGTNTIGGVGIPANVGLAHATREAVFFVDGDDWMEPAGFRTCRAAFDATKPDILIGNYLEHDEATGKVKSPSDIHRWANLPGPDAALDAVRMLALSMIAVPWRKFYRRDFLQAHSLCFPEGDFFFEDNPFHWQVCRTAQTIRFHDAVLCRHRMNRPGQTMASTGTEFLAFFDHYETICSTIAPDDTVLQTAALEWLVNNMSWQIGRMNPGVFWAYAARAAQVLEGKEALWSSLRNRYPATAIGGMVEALVRGQIAGTVAAWMADRTLQSVVEVNGRIDYLLWGGEPVGTPDLPKRIAQMSDHLQALHLIEEFRALQALDAADTMPQATI